MKISADQIEDKGIAGKTEDGRPVVYILTKGGLHAFFVKTAEGIASIGAAPHLAIARFLAGKKEKINWEEGFEKSENLAKSEALQFQKLRKMMFMPSFDKAVGPGRPSDGLRSPAIPHRRIENRRFRILRLSQIMPGSILCPD